MHKTIYILLILLLVIGSGTALAKGGKKGGGKSLSKESSPSGSAYEHASDNARFKRGDDWEKGQGKKGDEEEGLLDIEEESEGRDKAKKKDEKAKGQKGDDGIKEGQDDNDDADKGKSSKKGKKGKRAEDASEESAIIPDESSGNGDDKKQEGDKERKTYEERTREQEGENDRPKWWPWGRKEKPTTNGLNE